MPVEPSAINDPAVVAEVESAFQAYETALMSDDVTAMDAMFRDAAYTVRYGVGEVLYGFAEIAAFRRARAGGSPRRRLTRTVITTFGRDFAVADTEFVRDGETRLGRQSQSWVRFAEGWRVVAAHVSLQAERS